ncbi:MAG: acyltransferase [Bacteroidia bacterium]
MKPIRYFEHLDTLRFIAFFSVFALHVTFMNAYFNGSSWYQWISTSLIRNGDLGVNFFFVLSGFLITNLLLKEQDGTGKIHISSFYARRFLRIWPLYFAVVIIGFIILPGILSLSSGAAPFAPEYMSIPTNRWWYYVSFLANFDIIYNAYPSPILAVLWSVSVEEQFYIFWPLLLTLVPRKLLMPALFSVLIGAAVFRYFNWESAVTIRFHTLSCFSDISMGALLAYGLVNSEKLRLYFALMPRQTIVFPYIAALILIIIRETTYGPLFYPIAGWVVAIEPALFSAFFAFVIAEQHYSKESFVKFGRFKLLSKWGKLSYGMYCLHLVAIWLVIWAFKLGGFQPDPQSPWVFLVQIILSFALTVILATISYRFFESPFLKLKERFREAPLAKSTGK